jgi:hypothetical protein
MQGQIDLLQDQIQFLRCELERKDGILLDMTEGLKSLEAPREALGASVSPSEERGNSQHYTPELQEPSVRRSWWRRLFEG